MKAISEKINIVIGFIAIIGFISNIFMYLHEGRTTNAVISEQNKFFALQIDELKESVNELRHEMHDLMKARYSFYGENEEDKRTI